MEKHAGKASAAKDGPGPLPVSNGFDGQALAWATWPVEMWMKWQLDMLRAALPATNGWMERRHEGAESTLQALKKLNGCNDLRAALDIQSAWLEEERKRLESDFTAITSPFWKSGVQDGDATRNANA